jgi:predicted CoA-binding protein
MGRCLTVMPLTADSDIARVLNETRTVALLGASAKELRPSYRVMRFLLHQGYDVYPVNPGLAGQDLQGRRVFANLQEIPVVIDMVDVFRRSSYLPDIVTQVIAMGSPVLWTQLDVVHPAAIAAAEQAGLSVVADRCPAIEYPRLLRQGLVRARGVRLTCSPMTGL